MRLSVVLNTARGDFPYVDLPTTFIFEPIIRSLAAQTTPIHELIIVDGLEPTASSLRADRLRALSIEHLQPRGIKTTWLRPRSALFPAYVTICAAKNTGLEAATGDAVWFIDDGMDAPPYVVGIMLDYLRRGLWPSALCVYYQGGAPALAVPAPDQKFVNGFVGISHVSSELYGPGAQVRDARFSILDRAGVDSISGKGAYGEWWRGYTAAHTDQLRAIGGYDETLDGVKGLEDPDMGERMVRAHGRKLAIDRRIWVAEHRGGAYAAGAVVAEAVNPKCNYALIQASRRVGRARWEKRTRAEIDGLANACSACPNAQRCGGEHLGARWRPPNPTEAERAAYAAWEAAYVA